MENRENIEGYSFVKSAYYQGKLLRASDFIRDQEYVSGKLEYINRRFHGWGIVEGLEVQVMEDGSLRLSRGSAIDPGGRILEFPSDRRVEAWEIEALPKEPAGEFILGIRYAEKILETETALLDEEKRSQPVRIAETLAFQAYEEAQLQELRAGMEAGMELFTEEKLLYENENVALAVQVPRIVPADSLFRLRIRARAAKGGEAYIGWRGTVRLQGAVFIPSGEPVLNLEEERAICSGSLQREWEICTEESRGVPVLLEISRLEVTAEKGETVELPACQLHIETTTAYEQTVKKYLRARENAPCQQNWVPLARLKLEEGARQGQRLFSLQGEREVRFGIFRPGEEELLKRISRENGILDIQWRRLWMPPVPAPAPALPPPPAFGEGGLTGQELKELLEQERESHIRRGVSVIPIPRRCRRGRVIFSERIFHGFPGEEVLLWCGRVLEEQTYIYWKHGKKQYRILCGDEGLFPAEQGSRSIRKLALLQNVEEGSFQIALTLSGRGRRSSGGEVAVSWTALRID